MFFSVGAVDDEDYNNRDIIKFPHTFSNMHPGFPGWNPATNRFTCPYSGYYMFIVTLYKYAGTEYNFNYFAVLTMSNAGDVTWIYNWMLGGSSSATYSSSMSAIVPCNQGESVWVEMREDNVRLHDLSFTHYSQFSGLLIKEGLQ